MRAFLTGFTVFPQANVEGRNARCGAFGGGEASSERLRGERRGKKAEWHGSFAHWPAQQIFLGAGERASGRKAAQKGESNFNRNGAPRPVEILLKSSPAYRLCEFPGKNIALRRSVRVSK
jgi:hypothetical protein